MATSQALSPNTLAWLGAGAIAVLAWLFKWGLDSVKRQVDTRLSQRDRDDRDFRQEQVEDAYNQMMGQQVMTDCLHVMLRHMITGDHVEDLERAQVELNRYREANNQRMTRKAAKYNLR